MPDLSRILSHWASSRPGLIALRAGQDFWTYERLDRQVTELAEQIRSAGAGPGHRVAIISENDAAAVAAIFATWRAGAWAVPLNARYTERELSSILSHADPALILAFGDGYSRHGSRLGVDHAVSGDLEFGLAYRRQAQPQVDCDQSTSEQVVLMLYTSGTSGVPKGVMLPRRALVYMARLWAFRPVQVGDRVYQVLPISHSYGLCSYLFGALNMGCEVELASRFDPEKLRLAFREGVALFQGVPAMYARYLDHLSRGSAMHDAPALKAISTGGSPLDPDLKRRVEAVFGLELRQAYGLTEAGPTVTVPDSRPQAATALGRPGPDAEVRLVDVATGEESRSDTGEMWVRTPGVMKGYFRDRDATDAVLAADGWLRTGDIVRSAADGVLHIAGRAKEVIIRSGFNVYPTEVEAVLLTHPEVISAGVVGIPAAEGDESIVAFVELTRGAEVGVEELRNHAADRLAGYKRPSQIRVLAEMPLTVSGKVATLRLRELAIS
jgi:acyl-CoA synthetase (AMP-forming)/AMP-acid ligase II